MEIDKYTEYPQNILLWIFPATTEFKDLDTFDNLLEKIKIDFSIFKERDIEILKLYYKEKMTYNEIGKKYNITGSRVRQIIAKTIRKLDHPSISKNVLGALINNGKKEY